jgi:hypothetical protein
LERIPLQVVQYVLIIESQASRGPVSFGAGNERSYSVSVVCAGKLAKLSGIGFISNLLSTTGVGLNNLTEKIKNHNRSAGALRIMCPVEKGALSEVSARRMRIRYLCHDKHKDHRVARQRLHPH